MPGSQLRSRLHRLGIEIFTGAEAKPPPYASVRPSLSQNPLLTAHIERDGAILNIGTYIFDRPSIKDSTPRAPDVGRRSARHQILYNYAPKCGAGAPVIQNNVESSRFRKQRNSTRNRRISLVEGAAFGIFLI